MSEELKAILKREPVEIEIEENSMGELPFVKTRILLTPKEARVILNRVEELETLNKVLEGDKQQLLVAIEEAGNKTQKHIDDLEAKIEHLEESVQRWRDNYYAAINKPEQAAKELNY